MTLAVPLPAQVARDLQALAELYHATPEHMVASWTQTHVENLMAGLTPDGAAPETPHNQRAGLTPDRAAP